MLKFSAEDYHVISCQLIRISALAKNTSVASANLSKKHRDIIRAAYVPIKSSCEAIGLNLSAVTADRALKLLDGLASVTYKQVAEISDDLERRLKDELKNNLFLFITPEKAKFYEPTEPLFGNEVATKFPSGADGYPRLVSAWLWTEGPQQFFT